MSTAPTVSINIITKDQPDALEKCLASVYACLYEEGDEAVIVDTGSTAENLEKNREVVAQFREARLLEHPELSADFVSPLRRWLPDRVEEFEQFYPDGKLLLDFAAARNVAQHFSTKDLIFWIDTDDVLVDPRPGQLRQTINELMDVEKPEVDAIFLDYYYAFATDGTCLTRLRRERVYWRERYEWRGKCHETAIPIENITPPARSVAYVEGLETHILHTEARKPTQFSDLRNYVIMRKELEDADQPDPRTIFYLGNSCRGLGLFPEAIALYSRFNRCSGSEDDRFNAQYYVASIYMDGKIKRPHDAMNFYLECTKIKPFDPRGYFGVARCYAALRRWRTSLLWYDMGLTKRVNPKQMHSYDPTHVEYHPHAVATYCARELEEPELCVDFATKAAEARPNYREAQELLQQAKMFANGIRLTRSMDVVFSNLEFGGINARRVAREVCAELRGIPPELEKRGVAKCEPPDPRPRRKEVAIYCGHTSHEWGPNSAEKGLGGSEKMVLLISAALQSRGVNVSVYANVIFPERGIAKNGVLWRHWAEFDHERPRDAFVAWRNPQAIVAVQCPAKKRMVWNHDVQNAGRYTDDILAAVDYVQFQSEAHTEGCDVIPREKVWIARNAANGPLTLDLTIKDPKLVVFASSPDRGLLTAADIVAKARAVDPEIHLVVTYGFASWARDIWARTNHAHIPDLGYDACVDLYEQDVYAAVDKIDAQVLHRVSFDRMNKLWAKAGVWLYPTRFLEISCMAAQEAQAYGVIPVATRKHALKETISPMVDPWKLSEPPKQLLAYDEWLDGAAKKLLAATQVAATNPSRQALAVDAHKRFNVGDLAEEWIEKLGLEPVCGGPEPE
jgi:tetratricopeptide (TPR) repeat protein/glycosyltransferase involved in cell wall biosynthesis